MDMNIEPTKRDGRGTKDVTPARTDEIETSRLFADRREVRIRHGEEIYRLRLTRNGKLILNK